jgi:hypothetical protein
VVLSDGAGVPHLVQNGVLVGGVGGGKVRKRGQDPVALPPYRRLLVAERPAPRRQRSQLLALLGCRRPLAAATGPVLLGPKLLELGPDGAPAPVELEQPVDGDGSLFAAPAERRPYGVRVAADQLDVENASLLVCGRHAIRASS